jgi:adenylate kinase family enzyme
MGTVNKMGAMNRLKTGIPSVDLDELGWEPGWKQASDPEFVRRLEDALSMPQWVLSGNYSRVQEKYLLAADTVIWLDYSLPLILWRVGVRTCRRVVFRESCCNGNFESWRRTFSSESILLWVFRTYKRRRQSAQQLFESDQFPHLQKMRFSHPHQAQQWLDSL